MKYYKKILKESIAIVVFSSIFGLFSGTVLSFNDEILYAIPIILVILPALNSLIGDMTTVLVSRLTTHLYIGLIPPKIQNSDTLKTDFIGLFLIIFTFMFVMLFISAILLFKRGNDPNNYLIPFLTSFIDFLTPSLLVTFILLFM